MTVGKVLGFLCMKGYGFLLFVRSKNIISCLCSCYKRSFWGRLWLKSSSRPHAEAFLDKFINPSSLWWSAEPSASHGTLLPPVCELLCMNLWMSSKLWSPFDESSTQMQPFLIYFVMNTFCFSFNVLKWRSEGWRRDKESRLARFH